MMVENGNSLDSKERAAQLQDKEDQVNLSGRAYGS